MSGGEPPCTLLAPHWPPPHTPPPHAPLPAAYCPPPLLCRWHLKPSWGGYDWDVGRYGNVTLMLAQLHGMGLALGMNLHDADGVVKADNPSTWSAFAAALGLPANATSADFAIGDKRYADALAGAVMAPLMAGYNGAPAEGGLDLCWTDWQQGFPGVASVPGLVPTAILNHYRFYNCSGTGKGTRGTLHSRYAGRGDHRHTSHFGGDVDETWESLQFMIDFTKTAANAPACWWCVGGADLLRSPPTCPSSLALLSFTPPFFPHSLHALCAMQGP